MTDGGSVKASQVFLMFYYIVTRWNYTYYLSVGHTLLEYDRDMLIKFEWFIQIDRKRPYSPFPTVPPPLAKPHRTCCPIRQNGWKTDSYGQIFNYL